MLYSMKTLADSGEKRSDYLAPAFRSIVICTEQDFMRSNTEPIGGGDDPDIDW